MPDEIKLPRAEGYNSYSKTTFYKYADKKNYIFNVVLKNNTLISNKTFELINVFFVISC